MFHLLHSTFTLSLIFMVALNLRVGGANLLIHAQVDGYEAVVTDAGKQVVAVARQVQRRYFALKQDLIMTRLRTLVPEPDSYF